MKNFVEPELVLEQIEVVDVITASFEIENPENPNVSRPGGRD